MTTEKPTFCRICEPNCPLIASFDGDGSLTGLRPDMAHPSGGIACHKGLCYDRIHHDPDRLNWPQKRMNPKAQAQGDFQTVEWDDAMAEIGDRIRAVQDRHGPNSVAVYLGNPFAFNAAALLMAAQFQDLLGTAMRFSANTQDAANKFAAIGAVYGTAQAVMVPDIGNTSYLLCIGSNPKVSRWTTMSQPNDWDAVKAIKRRGGKILFINPRRTESSTADTGPTLLIRPGTDIYFLAAMLNEIASITDFKGATVDRYGKNLDGLRAFVSRYPADRVAAVTGIEADTIREVARDFLQAESAIAYSATGINQSRQGVLSVWLVEMLNFVTGNLGKKGGSYKPSGVADHFSPAGSRRQIVTSLGDFSLPDPIGFAVLPGALLPDLIACGDIRALFVLGGNPLLSAGGGMAARSAYAKLDLLVSVDIYRSATGEMSDFVLPSTDWLERPDINLISLGHQPFPMRNIATRWSRRWPGGATTGGYCRGWPRPSASTHHWTRTGTIMSGKATIDAVLGAGRAIDRTFAADALAYGAVAAGTPCIRLRALPQAPRRQDRLHARHVRGRRPDRALRSHLRGTGGGGRRAIAPYLPAHAPSAQ